MNKWIISGSENADDDAIAGQRLARARQEKNIPLRDIAKELHLDEPKVRALEENRFEDLGAAVFAKGHLKKYADLVGVPVDDVMSDYYKMTRSTPPPPLVGPQRSSPREFSPGPWIAGSVFLLAAAAIAALVYWYLTSGEANRIDDNPVNTTVESQQPDESVQEAVPLPRETTQDGATRFEEAEEPLPAAPDAGSQAADSAGNSPAAGEPDAVAELQLSLAFSGDCWTEVSDANGARLFFGLGNAGRIVNVSGVPPLQVLLGDSDNVAVQVNGGDYQIAAGDRRGNTASFTLEAR
ncbi:MAG: DUF4115 domain-containing protein [Gammaproteobacteria bacterium]|nr:DUF4115 domain-containing protein [Gammaproteobacteria bacterium]